VLACVQDDIKRVLAYSTVSQLGYMFLGAGVGSFTGAIFHVTTHAFFKAMLFLGAGAVIHALHHEQDMWKMGALRKKLPWTYWSFVAAWLAISGIFPFAGFWSKDEILAGAYEHNKILWAMGFAAAGLTALYMTRLMGLTFWGESRVDHHTAEHVHEVPAAMKWVLVALAVLSVVGGLLGIPGHHFLEGWLAPVFEPGHAAAAEAGAHAAEAAGGTTELVLAIVSVMMGAAGIGVGLHFYYKGKGEKADAVAERAQGVYRLLKGKWFVDELYDATVLRLYYFLCRVADLFDTYVVDGVVNRSADFLEASAGLLKLFQTGLVRNYALFFLLGAAGILWVFFR